MVSICSEDNLISVKICRTLIKPDQPQVVLVFFTDHKAVVVQIADVYYSLLIQLYNNIFASFDSQNSPLIFLDLNDVDKLVEAQILLNSKHIIRWMSGFGITIAFHDFLN